MQNTKVLLTGVTGFLGAHTAIQLLNKGYKVVGTLRNKDRISSIQEVIGKHTNYIQNLSFAEADITDKTIWNELTKGIDFVQHVASPFPIELPKNENELIIPARDGVLNILNAASMNKVKRVIITSSTATILYGKTKAQLKNVMNETTWTDLDYPKDIAPYFKSKTIAEKAAWDFVKNDTSGLELTTVLPGGILGPVLEKDFGTSANIVIKLMDGSMPAVPGIGFPIVDVRSVADALIKAMEAPTAGHRYIASTGFLMMKDVALILKEAYPNRKIPSRELPDFIVRIFSNFEKSLKPVLLDLGVQRRVDASKTIKELNWNPISTKDAVLACAKSILENGIVK
ncbi:SDR family oxidoreductase [Rhizosphaericola mali]|uniref:Aldehyde reductase n=1 Tax=Rhizosphaericola mali TaxID=2545455 RepID=A0A5P2G202_9BACT|nr:aldehyde reductase [Rhizosphaericola mali]QES87870.1 aldehyde reductase [Rhizosphaericola mali]